MTAAKGERQTDDTVVRYCKWAVDTVRSSKGGVDDEAIAEMNSEAIRAHVGQLNESDLVALKNGPAAEARARIEPFLDSPKSVLGSHQAALRQMVDTVQQAIDQRYAEVVEGRRAVPDDVACGFTTVSDPTELVDFGNAKVSRQFSKDANRCGVSWSLGGTTVQRWCGMRPPSSASSTWPRPGRPRWICLRTWRAC